MKQHGFSLVEMLLAMAIGSILMLATGKMLPLLQRETLQIQLRVHLQEELLQVVALMAKAVRRAGYCHGECQGEALHIQPQCLRVKWDENSNGTWEGREHANSEAWGFRLRNKSMEMARGVEQCDGAGWERISDSGVLQLSELHVERDKRKIRIRLRGYSSQFPHIITQVETWVVAGNLS